MRWAQYLHFHKNLIIPQHSAQLMYFFALLESSYCKRRQSSKADVLRDDVIRIISLAGIISLDDASDADWRKRRIATFAAANLASLDESA